MRIENVRVDRLGHDHDKQAFGATLQLFTEDGSVVLKCTATLPPDAPRREILHALLDHAVKQLRRMPEIRTGQQPIVVAHDALQTELDTPRNSA